MKKRLKDTLLNYKTEKLLGLITKYSVDESKWLTKEQLSFLWRVYNGGELPLHIYLEADERKLDLERFSKKDRKIIIEHEKKIAETGDLIRKIESCREEIAAAIAEKMLDKTAFQKWYLDQSDRVIGILRNVIQNVYATDEDGFFLYSEVPTKDYTAIVLETAGYAFLRKVPAWKTADDMEKITGVMISEEVLDMFKETDTEENDTERKTIRLISNCCFFAVQYYGCIETARVYDLYLQNINQRDDLSAVSLKTFIEIAKENIEKHQYYIIYAYKGKEYVTADMYTEILDEPDWMLLDEYLQIAEENSWNYYIPSTKEMNEFFENGYWKNRPCYKELKEFLNYYYLDEHTISNIGTSMFSLAYDDEQLHKNKYSMDDVENDTMDKLFDIIMMITGNNDVEDICNATEEITLNITEEANETYRRILEDCRMNTNLPDLLGYTRNQWEKRKQ